MKIRKASEIFIPGGMPIFTYVERAESSIRAGLEESKDHLCKLIALTGQTKSGKTVLTQKVFPELDENNIWINGGSISKSDDIWEQVIDELGGWTQQEESTSDTKSQKLHAKGKGTANALFIKGEGEIGGELSDGQTNSSKVSRSMSARMTAIRLLQQQLGSCSIVIDDFHYLDRELQGQFVRAVKPLVFHGLTVILIAIPHRRYDAVKVEREITGRIVNIEMPYWEIDELLEIPFSGFPLLNVTVKAEILDEFAQESMGSPHLMQEFCRALCKANLIELTQDSLKTISSFDRSLFFNVGDSTGKTIFDKLSKGPRQRSDRIQRKLKDGRECDIYKVVLLALAKLKPGMQTIHYEELRTAIREILEDSIPQMHEVSRVLDKMSEIAATDESSTPVIDWEKDEQRLHITDPFFAFYLKWGHQ